MDKWLEDEINDLGQIMGGRYVRFAYYKSMGMTNKQISEKEGMSPDYYNQRVSYEDKQRIKKLAEDLAMYHIKGAIEQTANMLKSVSTEAAGTMITIMRSANQKLSYAAAKDILKIVGVDSARLVEVDGELKLNLDERAIKAVKRIYGELGLDGNNSDKGTGNAVQDSP